ncbi:glycoside hydrolase family 73 protein [Clostridium oceanicum]|uniref:Glucosaminidase domain-containing protein n=1 Tax=Clostridium oceanicum TaxID=1543 RepID=A0ABN1JDT4_9CLOT
METRRNTGNINLKKIKVKKNKPKFFRKIFVFIILVIAVNFLAKFIYNKNKKFILPEKTMNIYIKAADDISEGKLQVSWKDIAAIDIAQKDENFSKVNIKDAKDLGEKFIISDMNGYKVINIKDVINKLYLDEDTMDSIQDYKEKLKDSIPVTISKEKEKFIDSLKVEAKKIYEKKGILPSVIIGQAILESNWGNSQLYKKSNNIFGIKAVPAWKGKTVNMKTSENYKDKINAEFRAYDSSLDSLEDYANFLTVNQRYRAHGLFKATQYKGQLQALEEAGYSTKKNEFGENIYAELVGQIIREYNLQLIDNEIEQSNI